MAEYLETKSFTHQDCPAERKFVTIGTLREVLEKNTSPKVSPELLDLFNDLLVGNHTKRLTAVDASKQSYIDYNVANGRRTLDVLLRAQQKTHEKHTKDVILRVFWNTKIRGRIRAEAKEEST